MRLQESGKSRLPKAFLFILIDCVLERDIGLMTLFITWHRDQVAANAEEINFELLLKQRPPDVVIQEDLRRPIDRAEPETASLYMISQLYGYINHRWRSQSLYLSAESTYKITKIR